MSSIKTIYRTKPARAESEIPLAAVEGDAVCRQLKLTTFKLEGKGLTTVAQVVEVDGNFTRFQVFGDYRATVRTVKLPATVRNVKAEHQAALASIEDLLKAAHEFYVNKRAQQGAVRASAGETTAAMSS